MPKLRIKYMVFLAVLKKGCKNSTCFVFMGEV